MNLLLNYDFPGNIRELDAIIDDVIQQYLLEVPPLKVIEDRIKNKSGKVKFDNHSKHVEFASSEDENIEPELDLPEFIELEASYYKEFLERAKGNKSEVARLLGENKRTVNHRFNSIEKELNKKGKSFDDIQRFTDLMKQLCKNLLP